LSDWVADTGPLIFLAKPGRLNLLRDAADRILIPSAVLAEVEGLTDDATSQIIAATESWLQVRPVENQAAVELLLADLDLGKTDVWADPVTPWLPTRGHL
jgi:predicted nucleic acid-binding protein